MLVHSGSRGLGESILRTHVDQHFGNGVEAESFAAEEYLRGHDFAVRWAKANRELIARRFAATLGAEAECLWDGCHNSITRQEAGWIHRKGAVAVEGDFVVIPGSRGSMSYIVKPTGDGESHAWSLAHGAGRKWARSDARQRMRATKLTEDRFEVPKDFDAKKFFDHSLGVMTGAGDYEVVIELDAWLTDVLRGRRWHPSQVWTELPGGGSHLRMRLSCLEEIEQWVLSWGTRATVLHPTELRNRVADIGRVIAARYAVAA